jgi:hypothetical protein
VKPKIFPRRAEAAHETESLPGPWAREKRLREILKPAKSNWTNREYKVDEMVRATIAERYRWT